jgi:aldehyde:ferredoxin oxidoreductase
LFSAITGQEMGMEELDRAGERIWNLQRLITMEEWGTVNLRGEHDVLPARFFTHPGTVEAPIQKGEWEQALDDYYGEMGWDVRTGAPTGESLVKLGLE